MRTIGEQVILGRGTDSRGQIGREFALQEGNDLAHALEGEAAAAKLGDDGGGDKLVPLVDAAMAMALGLDKAALIPPLQLAGGKPGKRDDVIGGEVAFHLDRVLFQTKNSMNVWNILGGEREKSIRVCVFNSD